MKLLTTDAGAFLTGDEIADVVMRLGLELMRRQDLAIVEVPFVADDGTVRRVELAIGWQMNLTSVALGSVSDEIIERDAVATLASYTETLTATRAEPFDQEEVEGLMWHGVEKDDNF